MGKDGGIRGHIIGRLSDQMVFEISLALSGSDIAPCIKIDTQILVMLSKDRP